MTAMKVVPVEPTEAMLNAASKRWHAIHPSMCTGHLSFQRVYEDMLSAVEPAPDGLVDDPVKLLSHLYYTAYHAGHHDTVEGNYTDVLPVDADDYWKDEDAVKEAAAALTSRAAVLEEAAKPDVWNGYRNADDKFDIEQFINTLSYSTDATDREKTLVAGNLRNLYAVLQPSRDASEELAASTKALLASLVRAGWIDESAIRAAKGE